MTWIYDGIPMNSDNIQEYIDLGYIGFVYLIENIDNNRKYIGKKTIVTTRKYPPLKGKKRGRTKIVQTDWTEYYGSSKELHEDIAALGKEKFRRTILHFARNKSTLSYLELKEQIDRNVLLDDQYYNKFIGAKVKSDGLKLSGKKK